MAERADGTGEVVQLLSVGPGRYDDAAVEAASSGRRRVLIARILLFAAASVGCALAPDLTMLLASRGMQGVGATLLMHDSLGILRKRT